MTQRRRWHLILELFAGPQTRGSFVPEQHTDFVSYGGSSMFASLLAVGSLQSVRLQGSAT